MVVTGGAGFIGSRFTTQLVERGHRVRVIDDFSSARLVAEARGPRDDFAVFRLGS